MPPSPSTCPCRHSRACPGTAATPPQGPSKVTSAIVPTITHSSHAHTQYPSLRVHFAHPYHTTPYHPFGASWPPSHRSPPLMLNRVALGSPANQRCAAVSKHQASRSCCLLQAATAAVLFFYCEDAGPLMLAPLMNFCRPARECCRLRAIRTLGPAGKPK